MPKVRTTLTIDAEVLRAVKVRGARTGKGDSEVIEEALRRELGFDLLERLWQRNDLGEFELVVSETLLAELQHALAYPKLAARVSSAEAEDFVALLRTAATRAADP